MISKVIKDLVENLRRLPTVSRKGAEILALYIVDSNGKFAENLAHTILQAKERVKQCKSCNNYCEDKFCKICLDERRDRKQICVVQNVKDLIAIEKSKAYNGLYHIIGGKLEPLRGMSADKLDIAKLVEKVKKLSAVEVVLALDPDLEGDTTALHLKNILEPYTKVSRIASGLPLGGSVELADSATIARSIQGKREF